ncbi:MAG: hypothetical protein ACYCOU_04700 [Sulfobacillus sp.]
MDQSHTMAKMIAEAIFYASIQASIGSVEMSSKFSVINFAKDQITLQRAADALKSYIIIGTIWSMGTALALYAGYDFAGILAALVANGVMMSWIFFSYLHAFDQAARQYGLQNPSIFGDGSWKAVGAVIIVGVGIFTYMWNCCKR